MKIAIGSVASNNLEDEIMMISDENDDSDAYNGRYVTLSRNQS